MRPEREAAEREVLESRRIPSMVKSAASTAVGLATGPALFVKAAPLLNKLVPKDLAVKGLSFLSPKFKKFFDGVSKGGFSIDEALDFLKNNIVEKGKEPKTDQPVEEQPKIDPMEQKRRETLQKFQNKQARPKMMQQEQDRFQQYYDYKAPEQDQEQGVSQGQALLLAALERNAKLRQQMGGQ